MDLFKNTAISHFTRSQGALKEKKKTDLKKWKGKEKKPY
jgi:hypothetical protein